MFPDSTPPVDPDLPLSSSSRVEYFQHAPGSGRMQAEISRFLGHGGVEEYHLFMSPVPETASGGSPDELWSAYLDTLAFLEIDASTAVFRRVFCSDPVNQVPVLRRHPLGKVRLGGAACATSMIGQPHLPSAHFGLWAYHIHDPAGPLKKLWDAHTLVLRRRGLKHLWTVNGDAPEGPDSAAQTAEIFRDYTHYLERRGMSLADHLVRTWLFVRDIDTHYGGVVRARRDWFDHQGLTADTHYVASTGIEGQGAHPEGLVVMDAYAIEGLLPEQVTYLEALDHLSPTHRYGVTFERGTTIAYRDRKQVILSGTASIDAHGKIQHTGDVAAQTHRTLENLKALLTRAGATLSDLAHAIVYLRDPADRLAVEQVVHGALPGVPKILLHAPVCRPGWLVEIEGVAILPHNDPSLPGF